MRWLKLYEFLCLALHNLQYNLKEIAWKWHVKIYKRVLESFMWQLGERGTLLVRRRAIRWYVQVVVSRREEDLFLSFSVRPSLTQPTPTNGQGGTWETKRTCFASASSHQLISMEIFFLPVATHRHICDNFKMNESYIFFDSIFAENYFSIVLNSTPTNNFQN
jgi:hypothetical protein